MGKQREKGLKKPRENETSNDETEEKDIPLDLVSTYPVKATKKKKVKRIDFIPAIKQDVIPPKLKQEMEDLDEQIQREKGAERMKNLWTEFKQEEE